MSKSKKQDLSPLLTPLHLTSFYIKFDSEEKNRKILLFGDGGLI